MIVGHRSRSLAAQRSPRWDEALSMIQKTRGAERCGSWLMIGSTRRSSSRSPSCTRHAPMDFRATNVPRREVRPRAHALVFVFAAQRPARRRRRRAVAALSSLDARLLVAREHAVLGGQGLAFPATFVEVEKAGRLLFEGGVAREDPAALGPGTDRVVAEPAPERCVPDRGDEPAADRFAADLGNAEPRERELVLVGQLAGKRLNGDPDAGEKSRPVARRGVAPRVRRGPPRRNACATC